MAVKDRGLVAVAQHDPIVLATAVVLDRLRSLPQADRDDLFELTKAFLSAGSDEDRSEVVESMLELLDCKEQGSSSFAVEKTNSGGMEKWLTYVSERIRALREAAGLTQVELAVATGLEQSHISRLENGKHSPSHLTIEKIAKALGVNAKEIDPSAVTDEPS